MKKYREILAEIEATTAAIEAAENEVVNLVCKEEKAEAIRKSDMLKYKQLVEISKRNQEKSREKCNSIYMMKIENRIRTDNMKAAIVAEVLPIIREAFQKYEGKSYGEKTRAKIAEAVKNAGFSFHVEGYNTKDTLVVRVLNDKGYYDYRMPDVRIHVSYKTPIIDAENKIHFASAEINSTPRYVEDVTGRAAEIAAAYKAYKEATEAASKAESALNAMLPDGMYQDNVKKVYDTLRV